MHYFGTLISGALLIFGLVQGPWALIPLAFVAGYGPAWVGHFFFEKNRPANFTYPLWSLRGDYHMFFLWATGRLRDRLHEAGASDGSAAA